MATTAFSASPSRAHSWSLRAAGIIALCFAINMADGVDVTILSYIAPRLQTDWSVGAAEMGNIFAAGLLGMAIGGMLIAPLADRYGRRRVILVALVFMSAGMIASGLVTSVAELFVTRIIVGAGIGAALAVMAALASETAPERHRNMAVGVVQAGYPFAAVFTGLVVAHLLPIYGWHALLVGAGVVTVTLLPAAILLIRTPRPAERATEARHRIGGLFAPEFRARTIVLWGAVFFGLMVLYFIVSWIPKLAIEAGLSETNGIYAGAVYNLGAFVGTIAMSLLSVRVRLGVLVPLMLTGAVAAMLAFGGLTMPVIETLAVAFAIGVLLQGGYNGVWPIAASSYPAALRATGIGWAIGIGRSGAILGPLMGGYLMAAKLSLFYLFAAYCVPLLACALCAWLVQSRGIRGVESN